MRFSQLAASVFAVCFLFSGLRSVDAGLLAAGDLTVAVGSSGTVNVLWSSNQTLSFLNTQFVLRAVTGTTGGAVFTEDGVTAGEPLLFAPINDPNYVFFGDSFAYINAPAVNPASVSADAWVGDSYFVSDSTESELDAIQTGSKLWTTFSITGVSAGTYQLRLLSSEYSFSSNTGPNIALTDSDLTGGLITVTGGAAVPEPSTLLIGATVIGWVARNRRRSRIARQASDSALA
jgi:hypothetical protein